MAFRQMQKNGSKEKEKLCRKKKKYIKPKKRKKKKQAKNSKGQYKLLCCLRKYTYKAQVVS